MRNCSTLVSMTYLETPIAKSVCRRTELMSAVSLGRPVADCTECEFQSEFVPLLSVNSDGWKVSWNVRYFRIQGCSALAYSASMYAPLMN